MKFINLFILFYFIFCFNIQIIGQKSDTIKTHKIKKVTIAVIKPSVYSMSFSASTSIFKQKQIENKQILTLSDISSIAPNFFMPDYGTKLTSPVYIRGIGSRINSPSVGLYVDNIPYFEKAAFAFDFFDISSIEILKGPQGTLFGRNTMGGIISIQTVSPYYFQGLKINLSASNFGKYSGNIGYYEKFNDKFAASISINYLQNDGYFTNHFDNSKIDKINSYAIRNKLIYKITDRLTLKNTLSFENSKQNGYPYAIYNDSLQITNEINYNQASGYNRKLLSDAFAIYYEKPKFMLIATTAYQFLLDEQNIDQDFTADSLIYVVQNQNQNMLSEEIIIRSKNIKRYNWLFGAFGFVQLYDKSVDVDMYKQKMTLMKNHDHILNGYALFHQSSIQNLFINNLTLTAGLRVNYEEDLLDYKYDIRMTNKEINKTDTIYPRLRYFQLLPKFTLNYDYQNITIYSTIAKGFKTGGFNTTIERDADLTYKPEQSWNYEIGTKMSLLHNKLTANLSVFYIDIQKQQIYQPVPSGHGSMLKNAGHSVSKGAELFLLYTNKNFNLSFSYGYNQAKFLSYTVTDKLNYNGNIIPYVPENTVSGSISKVFVLNHFVLADKIIVSGQYQGTGKIYWNKENTAEQKFYNLINTKISIVKKSLQIDFFVKNILNQKYNSFYFEALGNQYVQRGRPTQFGVNLSLKIK